MSILPFPLEVVSMRVNIYPHPFPTTLSHVTVLLYSLYMRKTCTTDESTLGFDLRFVSLTVGLRLIAHGTLPIIVTSSTNPQKLPEDFKEPVATAPHRSLVHSIGKLKPRASIRKIIAEPSEPGAG